MEQPPRGGSNDAWVSVGTSDWDRVEEAKDFVDGMKKKERKERVETSERSFIP